MKPGDKVYLKLVGFGVTSYEAASVTKVHGGKAWIDGIDNPFNAKNGKRSISSDTPFTIALCIDEIDIAAAKEYVVKNK